MKRKVYFNCPNGETVYCSLEDFLKICRLDDESKFDEFELEDMMTGLAGEFMLEVE